MVKFGSITKDIKMQKIKICGIKSLDEAKIILNLDIDYLGVIFAKSKRRVSITMASWISNLAHKNGKKTVGVFAKIDQDFILQICRFANIDVAQIYDDVSPNLYNILHSNEIEIWKVFRVSDELPNLNDSMYDMAMFDYKGKNLGGNGASFDWEILKNLKPYSFGMAGGIGLENVKLAASYKPALIDINSKVEDENGIKNPEIIKEILNTLS